MDMEAFIGELRDSGISEFAFIRREDMLYSQRLRDYCEWLCPGFNHRWGCPPHVGSIDDNIRKCRRFPYALMLSAYVQLDPAEIATCGEPVFMLSRRKLNPLFQRLGRRLAEVTGGPVLILHSYCNNCLPCAFPDAPCRHPDRSVPSLESHGIQMVTMMEDMGFTRFSNDRGYTCVALVLFDCGDEPDVEFGRRVLLKEYPPFVEDQAYADHLYSTGACSSRVDLAANERYAPGIHAFNGATGSSVCLLSCDSHITTALLAEEIGRSGIPVNLLVLDTHGHTVSHAYSEGLFTTDTISRAVRGLESEVGFRDLVIPYGIFMLRHPLQRALPGWRIHVGAPRMRDLADNLSDVVGAVRG